MQNRRGSSVVWELPTGSSIPLLQASSRCRCLKGCLIAVYADASQMDAGQDATEYLVLDGPDFRRAVLDADGNLRQSAFDAVWRRLRVLARCSPADKFTIVKGAHVSIGCDLGSSRDWSAETQTIPLPSVWWSR